MEPNENQLGSYYHHQPQQLPPHRQLHHQQHQTTTANANIIPSTTASPTNGLLPNAEGSHTVYPHSVASAVSSHLETVKRKRGRPRKYGTQEQALAAKKAAAAVASSSSHSYSKDKKDRALAAGSSADASFIRTNKKVHSFSGQGFIPHILSVAADEDVGQKIMMFMQQSRCELCILSASGSISNASLCQSATSGGSVTYEGHFDIISLSGSYIRTELGGRTGGLSVCLSSTDGQIIGGGVGGPLKAAGPVLVIVGTFFMETKKNGGVKGGSTGNKLPLQIEDESISNVGFHSVVDSSGASGRGNGDHQAIGASHFMIQSWSVQVTPGPTDWRDHADARNTGGYELSGRSQGAQEYPENGDYDQIPD